MAKLTQQEIFDKALFGIRKQGYRQSTSESGGCNYRTTLEDGSTRACAVGLCIPDDIAQMWDSSGETTGDTSIRAISDVYTSSFEKYFYNEDLPFLSDLQDAHDCNLVTSYLSWEDRMQDIAAEYYLVYTPVGEVE